MVSPTLRIFAQILQQQKTLVFFTYSTPTLHNSRPYIAVMLCMKVIHV